MGLFVVGRLAARHGIKVRLQPADSGGLTALVWLPDAIVVRPAAPGTGRPRRPDGPPGPILTAGPRQRPEASAKSMWPAPALEDTRVGRAGHQGRVAAGHAAPPTAQDQRRQPSAAGESRGRAPPAHLRGGRVGLVRRRGKQFRRHGGGRGQLGVRPVDDGWRAAEAVIAPSSSGVTTAGLPVRVPRANLVPGAISGPQPDSARVGQVRSAARDRLSGFQQGTSQGRAAAMQPLIPATRTRPPDPGPRALRPPGRPGWPPLLALGGG